VRFAANKSRAARSRFALALANRARFGKALAL
jgi:hypothetical protein